MTAFAETPQNSTTGYTMEWLPALNTPEDYTQLWYGQLGDIMSELPRRLSSVTTSLGRVRQTFASWPDEMRETALKDWQAVDHYAGLTIDLYGCGACRALSLESGCLQTAYNKKPIRGNEVVSLAEIAPLALDRAQELGLDEKYLHAGSIIGTRIINIAVARFSSEIVSLAHSDLKRTFTEQNRARVSPKTVAALQDISLREVVTDNNARMVRGIDLLYGHLDRIHHSGLSGMTDLDERILQNVVDTLESTRQNNLGTLSFRAKAEKFAGFAPESRQIEIIKAVLDNPAGLDIARASAVDAAARIILQQ